MLAIKIMAKTGRWIEEHALIVILFGMMMLAVIQILMRNLFGGGFSWIDPLVRIAVLWIAMLGAMVGTRKGEHIAIDILSHYIPEHLKSLLIRTIGFVSALASGMMAWVSVSFVLDEFEYGMEAFGSVPAWPFMLIIPIGFFVMTLRFSIQVILGKVEETA